MFNLFTHIPQYLYDDETGECWENPLYEDQWDEGDREYDSAVEERLLEDDE